MNILLILSDKLRHDAIGIYGNNIVKTPVLDKLANSSAVFQKAYCTTPKCAPSRAAILSGLYPNTTGFITNEMEFDGDTVMLSDILKNNGFRTGYFGKWHLGDEVVPHENYDRWVSTEDRFWDHYSRPEYRAMRSDYHHFLINNGFLPDIDSKEGEFFSRRFATRIPERFSKPAFISQSANSFIEDNKNDKFFMCVSFLEPHAPFNSVFDEMYDPDQIKMQEAYHIDDLEGKPLKCFLDREYTKKYGISYPLPDEKEWRKFKAKYLGQASLVDKYIGVIIDALHRCKCFDDTLILFTSDHGGMLGDFRLLKEDTLHEGCTRVPYILKIPELTKEKMIIDDPVSHIDIVPTLLEAASVEYSGSLDGTSLIGYIKNTKDDRIGSRPIILESTGKSVYNNNMLREFLDDDVYKDDIIRLYGHQNTDRAIVYKGFKYIHSGSEEHELYDLINDPIEKDNIFDDRKYKKIQMLLRKTLIDSFGL